jgi:lysophospholipase L1-like esterase
MSRSWWCLHVAVAGALAATALTSAAAPPPSSPPLSAFPGQYALPPVGQRYPVWPKGCRGYRDAADRLACAEFILDDWARLDRYAAANTALAPPRAGETRVVFMGDSITDLWSRPGRGGFFPGRPYVNRGIGGQTTAQMLGRFRADVVALRPRVVVIHAGTNDVAGNTGPTTPEAIENNLASMADLARAGGIRVVLAALLPVSDDKAAVQTKERPPEALRNLNRWMAEYAARNGLVYLDYWTALADGRGMLAPALTDDGLHPNAAGYAVMAPLAEQAIARALR